MQETKMQETKIQILKQFENDINYPFINKLVDNLYDQTRELIDKHVENESEKSIFMMFILMYYTIHLKLTDKSNNICPDKDTIKTLLNDIISDHNKRRLCLQMFENKIKTLFIEGEPSSSNGDKSKNNHKALK